MNDVTRILLAIENGDPRAANELLPLVYDELRRLASQRMTHEKPGHVCWDHRGHFFAAAAEAMRRIVVENARRKQSRKRGGGMRRHHADLDDLAQADARDPLEALAVHEALDSLAQRSPRKAELVKLRYFLGCTMAEAAHVLGIAQGTAEDDWTYAKAWLHRQWLRGGKMHPPQEK